MRGHVTNKDDTSGRSCGNRVFPVSGSELRDGPIQGHRKGGLWVIVSFFLLRFFC